MSAPELLRELQGRGVAIRLHGGRLLADGPESALTPAVLDTLRVAKPDLLRILAGPRCPACQAVLPIGESTCRGGCDLREVHSVRGYPAPGPVAPSPAPDGEEYEPGADWAISEEVAS